MSDDVVESIERAEHYLREAVDRSKNYEAHVKELEERVEELEEEVSSLEDEVSTLKKELKDERT